MCFCVNQCVCILNCTTLSRTKIPVQQSRMFIRRGYVTAELSRVVRCILNHAFSEPYPRRVLRTPKNSRRGGSSSSTSPGNRPSESRQDASVVPDSGADDEEMPENQRAQMPLKCFSKLILISQFLLHFHFAIVISMLPYPAGNFICTF